MPRIDDNSAPLTAHAVAAPATNDALQIAHLASTGRLAMACAIHLHGLLDVAVASAARVVRATAGSTVPALDELRDVLARAGDVTRQLLTSAHRPADETTLVDLADLVDQMRPMIALLAGPDAFAVVVRDAVDVIALANRGAIEQILVNLIVGPAESASLGRRITISSGFIQWPGGPACDGELLPAGAYAMLSVSDERRGAQPAAPIEPACPACGVVPEVGVPMAAAVARACGGGLLIDRNLGGAHEHRVLLPAASV